MLGQKWGLMLCWGCWAVSLRELICVYEIIKKRFIFQIPLLAPYQVRIDGMHWKTAKFGEKNTVISLHPALQTQRPWERGCACS